MNLRWAAEIGWRTRDRKVGVGGSPVCTWKSQEPRPERSWVDGRSQPRRSSVFSNMAFITRCGGTGRSGENCHCKINCHLTAPKSRGLSCLGPSTGAAPQVLTVGFMRRVGEPGSRHVGFGGLWDKGAVLAGLRVALYH